MTNKELIKKLQEFPENDEVDFMLFAESTPRRGDAENNHVMIKRNRYQYRTCIMIDLPRYFERDIIDSYNKLQKVLKK